MKTQSLHITRSILIYGSIVLLLGCNVPSTSETEGEDGPADVEAVYFNLSKEAQTEVLGAQVKPLSEMRKELLAKADTDGDGKLNEAEKAALRKELKVLKDEMKAELKAKLDSDGDGEVSDAEKKAGLDGMGQKIKDIIQTKHEELRTAQRAARERIKAACGEAHGKPDDAGADAALDVDTALESCRAVAADEKDKLHAKLKESLEAIKAEIEELKGILVTVESQSATI